MGSPLQRRTPTYGTGSRYSRSPRPAASSFQVPIHAIAGENRIRSMQIDPRRIASRILPRAFLCVTEFLRTTPVLSHVKAPVWSAKTQSRTGRREEVFVMQSAEDRFAWTEYDSPRRWRGLGLGRMRRPAGGIGNTGTQCHMWASAAVVGNP